MSPFNPYTFIIPYVGSDKVIKFQTNTNVKVGGINVCQYIKSASEGNLLWITTVAGKLTLDFATLEDAKAAQIQFDTAIETLLPNCVITPGGGIATYTFTQSTPSATWNINHNLNSHPSVTLIDTGDIVIYADIQYIDTNNIVVLFSTPVAGKAYLN